MAKRSTAKTFDYAGWIVGRALRQALERGKRSMALEHRRRRRLASRS